MPKNSRWIIVVDVETDSPKPETANIVQLAAVPINPETLEIKRDEAFNMVVKPNGIDSDDYMTTEREGTIKWHAGIHNTTPEKIVAGWKKDGVAEEVAWKAFCTYCEKYKVAKRPGQWYPEPIAAGYNITGFDLPILQRIADRYSKGKMPFSKVTKLDAMDMLFWWFESLDEPKDFKLDTWRKFFGMTSEGTAHDALVDVYEEAEIITRFLKFHRKQASVDKFKGKFV